MIMGRYRIWNCLVFVALCLTISYGQTAEQQEIRLQEALKAMNRMEHWQAHELFMEATQNTPYNPLAPFGALANEWIYNQGKYGFRAGNNGLLEGTDKLLLDYRRKLISDPNNPEIEYYIGLTNGLKARVLLAEKNWFGVLISGYRIIRNIKSAYHINPENPDIIIAFGVFNYYVGLSSGFMQIASWIMQTSGSKEEGLQQLEVAATYGNYSRYEARSILAYLNLYFEANYTDAKKWLDILLKDFPENPYYNYLYADLYIRTGNPGIECFLEKMYKRLPVLDTYFQKEYYQRLLLLEGSQALLNGQLDTAEIKLLEYIKHYDSEMDYDLASCYLRLGKVYDLQGKRPEAVKYYRKTVDLNNRSSAVAEAKKLLDKPNSSK